MQGKKLMFVYARGGTPLEHALPRIACCAELHVLALMPMPTAAVDVWKPCCSSITFASSERCRGEALVDVVVEHAQRLGVDAIFTLSEFAVLTVAHAADRLGLCGSGLNTVAARDKRRMRQVWRDADVPVPRFYPVASEDDIHDAYRSLRPPILLKSAWGAGSVGQMVIEEEAQIDEYWARGTRAVADSFESGYAELYASDAANEFLVEEIIQGSTRTWYGDDSRYGDYLSVEGIVARGRYHPICITGRIPTIPPFTELNNMVPCVLPELLQRKIEGVARSAVDALGLDTCGTHTELKLADHGELMLIESAARLGGVMVAKEIESVFGYDAIGMLVRELLGEVVEYPDKMLTSGNGGAASLSLIATDAIGVPWRVPKVWNSTLVDWKGILSPGSSIAAVAGLTVPDGTVMPSYDSARGADNYAGIFFLQAANAEDLLEDCYSVLNSLEGALRAADTAPI